MVFLVLTLWVYVAGYPEFNTRLFLWLNQSGRWSDLFWQHINILGEGIVAFVLVGCLSRRDGRLIWLALLAAIIAGLASQGVKEWLGMLRPAVMLDQGSFVVVGEILRFKSFPSGHATTALTAAALLAWRFPGHGLMIYGAALFLAFGRIASGAHWPFDVVAGSCLGFVSGRSALLIARNLKINQALWQPLLAWLLLALVAVALVFFRLDYPRAQLMVWVIALLGIGCAVTRVTGILVERTNKKGAR